MTGLSQARMSWCRKDTSAKVPCFAASRAIASGVAPMLNTSPVPVITTQDTESSVAADVRASRKPASRSSVNVLRPRVISRIPSGSRRTSQAGRSVSASGSGRRSGRAEGAEGGAGTGAVPAVSDRHSPGQHRSPRKGYGGNGTRRRPGGWQSCQGTSAPAAHASASRSHCRWSTASVRSAGAVPAGPRPQKAPGGGAPPSR
ncbi:hypothetical protein SHIRM173S_02299 [Streptomyces hirsutus]